MIMFLYQLTAVQPSPVPVSLPSNIVNHVTTARDFSPPVPTPAPDHLSAAHHQVTTYKEIHLNPASQAT